jgi:YteA family regulatory protein
MFFHILNVVPLDSGRRIIMISNEKKATLKKRLMNRKQQLNAIIGRNDHFDLENAHANETVGELSNYDNHPGDLGTELYEREKDIALNEHSEKELEEINHALAKMEQGAYGICEVCGKEIDGERLEVLPTATVCVDDSKNKIVHHERPVEEDVLGTPFKSFVNDDRDATFYDAEDTFQAVASYGTSDTPSDFGEQNKDDYNEMIAEGEELEGFVEDLETFVGNDIDGKNTQIYPNRKHEQYEAEYDETHMNSSAVDASDIDFFGGE